jgi:hypothetical protein
VWGPAAEVARARLWPTRGVQSRRAAVPEHLTARSRSACRHAGKLSDIGLAHPLGMSVVRARPGLLGNGMNGTAADAPIAMR